MYICRNVLLCKKFFVVIKRLKYILPIYFFFNAVAVFSQVSELHLFELANCIPEKHKDAINSIELSYKDGVALYDETTNGSLSDQVKIDKLASLFKLQVVTKLKLQEIWEQSDSISRERSAKYFTEASLAYKGLTDTINLVNPQFKTPQSGFIAVERMHQIIILQKFGIQVLFGCVRESTGKLGQPTDISNVEINIDMIERFRKVWNEANYPMTYEQWAYTPTERKSFTPQKYSDLYKENRFGVKKESTISNPSSGGLTSGSNGLASQNSLSFTSGTNDNSKEGNSNRSTKGNFDSKGNNGSTTNFSGQNNSFSIKGEGNRLNINKTTQFEIKNLIAQSKIKELGVAYFTIQIAASKNQLDRQKLKKEIYCGNYDIDERNENGWYKYLVGHFTSIDSANSYLAIPCITRGFVSGYNAKGRVAIFSMKQPILSSGNGSIYSIVYRVQIAASRQPISNSKLSAIYKGFNPINISQEDGWYRYSIGDFVYYDEAKVARDSCGTKDAFVMPYQNQKRIQWPGKDALELLKVKQKEDAIYVIQVAASHKPLPLQVINDIIKVDYPLTMKFEDGWYKYYISAFIDFAAAKEVAAKIGIKGTFIATYKNGIRVKP